MTAELDITPEGRADAQRHVVTLRRIGLTPSAEWLALAGESEDKPVQAEAPEIARIQRERRTYDAAPSPTLMVRPYSEIERERLDWLWMGYIPLAKLTILDGDPKLGKSTLMLDVAARVSRGLSMPPQAGREVTTPADVLILSAEDDSGDTIGPRLDAARADSSRIHEVKVDGLLSFPEHIDLLRDAIKQTGARLVVIDPFVAYVSGRLSVNSDQEVRKALVPLAALADETGAAIVLVRHLRKAGGSAIQRGGGSIGIAGQARSVLAVARDPDDPERRLLTVTGGNVGPESESPTLAFRVETWTGSLADGTSYGAGFLDWEPDPVDLTADDLLNVDDNRPRTVKVKDRPHAKAGQALRAILIEAGPLPAKEALGRLQDRNPAWVYTVTGGNVQHLKSEADITSRRVYGPDGQVNVWMVEADA